MIQSLFSSVDIDGDSDLLTVHTSVIVLFITALVDELNCTITAVILSHPVPSPQVSGARQWSNSYNVIILLINNIYFKSK